MSLRKLRAGSSCDGVYEINAASAKSLFDNRAPNRQFRETKAARIADDIAAGNYVLNGETIIFDTQGRVIDGQHRLRAITLANRSVQTYCIFLEKDGKQTFDTIDTGISRSSADRLEVDGVQNSKICAALIRLIIQYESIGNRSHLECALSPTQTMVHERYELHKEEVDEAAAVGLRAWALSHGILSPTIFALLAFYCAQYDKAKCNLFLHGLSTGENLVSPHPILLLRDRLIASQHSQAAKLQRQFRINLCIKAWNAFATDAKMTQLKVDGETVRFVTK